MNLIITFLCWQSKILWCHRSLHTMKCFHLLPSSHLGSAGEIMEILSLWRRQGKTDLPGLGLVFSCGWCILEIYISTTCWAVHIIYCGDTSNYKFCEIVCFSVWMCAMWLNWNIFISIFTSHIPNTITTRNTFQIRENTGLCWSGGLVSHQVNICPNWLFSHF